MIVGNTLRHGRVQAPFEMQLEVILTQDGDIYGLRAEMFEELPIEEEMRRYRSIAFVADLIAKAKKKGTSVEVVISHLKMLGDFECEVAVLKTVRDVQAEFWAAQTRNWLKGRAA